MNLDNLNRFHELDSENMLGHIDALPDQLEGAWAHAQTLAQPTGPGDVKRVVVCGMGGSAIGGDLLAALVAHTCAVPITVNRTYDLSPLFEGPETLVIGVSHSGNTEEMLSAVRQGVERGARLLAITTGGKLAQLAADAGGTLWTYAYRSQPRGALGWLYGMLLGAASRLGLADGLADDVTETVAALRQYRTELAAASPVPRNPAKRLAGQLIGRIPVIWGAGLLAPVAARWKTQLNENSKTCAYFEIMPELNHNSVVGVTFPGEMLRHVAVVQLISPRYQHPRVALRFDVTRDLLLQEAIAVDVIEARGESRLAQQMTALHFGDYVSYYVAMAYGVDPTPIPPIVMLKERLAKVE